MAFSETRMEKGVKDLLHEVNIFSYLSFFLKGILG
jgi:hypothetical protein